MSSLFEISEPFLYWLEVAYSRVCSSVAGLLTAGMTGDCEGCSDERRYSRLMGEMQSGSPTTRKERNDHARPFVRQDLAIRASLTQKGQHSFQVRKRLSKMYRPSNLPMQHHYSRSSYPPLFSRKPPSPSSSPLPSLDHLSLLRYPSVGNHCTNTLVRFP